jgi:predicted dehydrogenase
LVTACPTSSNAQLVIEAARRGKHILSVKPFAMNLREASEILAAVKEAGVRFISYDAGFRFNPLYQKIKSLLDEGKLGKPLSAHCYFRTTLPDIAWFGAPILRTRTWWLDPEKAPAGAWLDHGIYFIDLLRWMFSSEVERIYGEVAKLRHFSEPLEDFGVATLVFRDGQVATIESTWTTEMSGMNAGLQLSGSRGQAVQETITRGQMLDLKQENRLKWMDYTDQVTGWQPVEMPPASTGLTAHMLRVLHGEEAPIANEQDALRSLATGLALYQASKTKQAIELPMELSSMII